MTDDYPRMVKAQSQKLQKYGAKPGMYELRSGKKLQFDSKQEAILAQQMEDQGIPFHRYTTTEKAPVQVIKKENRYPDFRLETDRGPLLVEVKGYLDQRGINRLMEMIGQAVQDGWLISVLYTGREGLSTYPKNGHSGSPSAPGKLRRRLYSRGFSVPVRKSLREILDYFEIQEVYSISEASDEE